jgi:hypothetical protein
MKCPSTRTPAKSSAVEWDMVLWHARGADHLTSVQVGSDTRLVRRVTDAERSKAVYIKRRFRGSGLPEVPG